MKGYEGFFLDLENIFNDMFLTFPIHVDLMSQELGQDFVQMLPFKLAFSPYIYISTAVNL